MTSELSVRRLTDDDFAEYHALLVSAFLEDPDPEHQPLLRRVLEMERHHGVFDGAEQVGGCGVMTRTLTVPGGRARPLAAVTQVGVKPGHRRRGIMRMMMRAQLHALHEAGAEPVAGLEASEAGIYGRYGYAPATEWADIRVPRGTEFRSDVDTGPDPVREAPRQDALPRLRELHDRAASRVGWLDRSAAVWDFRLADRPRADQTAYRFATHPRGYAVYRLRHGEGRREIRARVEVLEIQALDAVAAAALWRYLLDIDLVSEVQWSSAAVDDPIRWFLADSRRARVEVEDALWLRIVDLDRALPARTYAAEADVVFQVSDQLCPWNAGRWRMAVDADGQADVRRTDAEPGLSLDITALAAAYLGGTPLAALADAGLVTEHHAGSVRTLSRAFLADRSPHCLVDF
ncbi:GNAT family N-acetyltransferase [Actinoalloteichus spitiensis]|uniref:GNAT family N-acetyltransferase n=1 Tax=Actinoalloteichus spitiensis TaxID=252394 RepID=UPI0003717CC5|nr:GNAT family N-acetyltransferase [Actinoalloteichus spitiensis]